MIVRVKKAREGFGDETMSEARYYSPPPQRYVEQFESPLASPQLFPSHKLWKDLGLHLFYYIILYFREKVKRNLPRGGGRYSEGYAVAPKPRKDDIFIIY